MNSNNMADFIHELRKEKGMTQRQLAEKLNITDKAVSKWERGLGCPDISILSSLADNLGVTVTELLNGERSINRYLEGDSIVKTTSEYVSKTISSKKKSMKYIAKILITAICLLGIAICIICDMVVSGAFTWSLYPIASIVFAWLILIPLLQSKRNNLRMALISASVFIIPFLFIINKIMGGTKLILPIGIPVSLIIGVYIWIIYFLSSTKKLLKWNMIAISILLGIPVSLIINSISNKLTNKPIINIWNILSFGIMAVLSIGFFIIGKKKSATTFFTR